jgi:rhodanese-related sulfurtransferase
MDMTDQDGYAGDVTADEAYILLDKDPESLLIDVRTHAEWAYVGVPDLSKVGKEPILFEWQQYPNMIVRSNFAEELAKDLRGRGVKADAPILFLCRSGVRSRAAAVALTEVGFTRCFNITGGFEGPPDADKHRGRRDGWKAKDLPWIQS